MAEVSQRAVGKPARARRWREADLFVCATGLRQRTQRRELPQESFAGIAVLFDRACDHGSAKRDEFGRTQRQPGEAIGHPGRMPRLGRPKPAAQATPPALAGRRWSAGEHDGKGCSAGERWVANALDNREATARRSRCRGNAVISRVRPREG